MYYSSLIEHTVSGQHTRWPVKSKDLDRIYFTWNLSPFEDDIWGVMVY